MCVLLILSRLGTCLIRVYPCFVRIQYEKSRNKYRIVTENPVTNTYAIRTITYCARTVKSQNLTEKISTKGQSDGPSGPD